jgi:hypothetical protein
MCIALLACPDKHRLDLAVHRGKGGKRGIAYCEGGGETIRKQKGERKSGRR